MSWEIDTLGNYSKVISGYAFKSDSFRTDNGIPIIKIKNIQREYVEIDGEYFVDTSYLSLDPKFHCIKDDILISLTGSHITLPNSVVGRVAKYHYDFTSLLNQRGGKIVVTNPEKLENNYLYYYLCQNEIRIKLAQFGRGGANQCNISPSNVESIPIVLPPLETQKRIASILSTYDDLIENNLKRIKLLEETAQNIYKEWFVNFRFPNYEHTEFDVESGLPVGWERKRLDEVYEFQNGYAFYTNGYSEEVTPYVVVDLGNISESGDFVVLGKEKFISESLYQDKERYYLNKYDVIVAMTDMTSRLGILAKVGIIDEDGKYVLNQRVGRLRSKIDYIDYCYVNASLSDERFISEMHQRSKGAVQKYFNTKDIIEYNVVVPSKHIIDEFNTLYRPIIENRIVLKFQNQKLREARDILLPRLMNRTIEV